MTDEKRQPETPKAFASQARSGKKIHRIKIGVNVLVTNRSDFVHRRDGEFNRF